MQHQHDLSERKKARRAPSAELLVLNVPILTPLYETLNDANNEIRILEILPVGQQSSTPSTNGSLVECKLHTVSMNDDLEFAAISYAWGDPEVTAPIIVNGMTVNVTTNLEAALQQFRKDDVKMLWADAVCINQQDIDERNHHVQKMKMIYSHATEVLAWLGVEDSSGKMAFAMKRIRELSKVAFSQRIRNLYDPHIYEIEGDRREQLCDFCTSLLEESIISDMDRRIAVLLRRKWWTRLWTVQEVESQQVKFKRQRFQIEDC